ncbi:MAG: HNH endonuclease family protein, partial [Propionicimonas sp.]
VPHARGRRTRRSSASAIAAIALLAAALGGSRLWTAGTFELTDGWGTLNGAGSETDAPSPAASALPSAVGGLVGLVVDDALDDVPAYTRIHFGARWADVDRNGCDQRNDTLSANLADVQYRAGTRDCVVETGTFTDLYTGQTRPFVKSESGGGVDIDHVVPLENAWRSGAWAWTDEQRLAYANDLTLLVPTDASLNRSKGSQDPSSWLPPADGGYVCTYLERWVEVKTTWHLTVTSTELRALSSGLANCP